jgi:hypothetical protein
VTRCRPVSVTPKAVVNSSAEIPANYNGSEVFIDPISYVIKSNGTSMKCTDIAPPRFQIGGRWYCLIAHHGLSECHQPLALPIAAVEIDHESRSRGASGDPSTQRPSSPPLLNFSRQRRSGRHMWLMYLSWPTAEGGQMVNGGFL